MSRDHNSDFISDVKPLLSNCMCRFSDLPSGVANAASISLVKSVDFPLLGLNLYGKSTQGYASHGGTPLGKNLISPNDIVFGGFISETGVEASPPPEGSYRIRTSFLPAMPLRITFPQVTKLLSVYQYDGDKTFIGHYDIWNDATTFVIEKFADNCQYIRLLMSLPDSAAIIEDSVLSLYKNGTMVEKDTGVSSPYEPYYSAPNPSCPVPIENVGDDGEVKVQCCGKNLLDISPVQSTTKNGVTFTVNTDGSVLVNGTASAYVSLDLITLTKKSDYIYSGTPKDGGTGTTGMVTVRITKTDGTVVYGTDRGAGSKLIIDDTVELAVIRIELHTGASPDNVIFYPMLRYATEEDATYEPYTGSTASLTTALPLCGLPVTEGGNYTDSNGQQWVCDELIYNTDGTGKVVKRLYQYSFTGEEPFETFDANAKVGIEFRNIELPEIKPIIRNSVRNKSNAFCSHGVVDIQNNMREGNENHIAFSVWGVGSFVYFNPAIFGTIDELKEFMRTEAANGTPLTIVYELATPEEIELTVEEMAQLYKLYSYNGTTNVFNDEGAEMSISACTNPVLAAEALPIIKRLEAQAAASQTTTTTEATETT